MSTTGPLWTTLCRNMVLVINKLQLTREPSSSCWLFLPLMTSQVVLSLSMSLFKSSCRAMKCLVRSMCHPKDFKKSADTLKYNLTQTHKQQRRSDSQIRGAWMQPFRPPMRIAVHKLRAERPIKRPPHSLLLCNSSIEKSPTPLKDTGSRVDAVSR